MEVTSMCLLHARVSWCVFCYFSFCAFGGAAVLKAVGCFSEKSIATDGWEVCLH